MSSRQPDPGRSLIGSNPDDLRITRVFSCAARGSRACASFMFAGCCWRRSLAVDGRSGASEGHGPVMRRFSVRRPEASHDGYA